MIVGVTIFAVFSGLAAILIFSYEKPPKKNKITGRGGDFAE